MTPVSALILRYRILFEESLKKTQNSGKLHCAVEPSSQKQLLPPLEATIILHTSFYAKTSPSLRSKFPLIKITKLKLKYEAIIHRGSHPAWWNSTEELRHGPPLNAATGGHCGTRMSHCPHHLQSASSR